MGVLVLVLESMALYWQLEKRPMERSSNTCYFDGQTISGPEPELDGLLQLA
jgi:hypothetical protein